MNRPLGLELLHQRFQFRCVRSEVMKQRELLFQGIERGGLGQSSRLKKLQQLVPAISISGKIPVNAVQQNYIH